MYFYSNVWRVMQTLALGVSSQSIIGYISKLPGLEKVRGKTFMQTQVLMYLTMHLTQTVSTLFLKAGYPLARIA